MRTRVFKVYTLRGTIAVLESARYFLDYAQAWFKFRIMAGTIFPTYVVDELAALVLGLGCQTKWFGLFYDIKLVLYLLSYFMHDFPYATLVHC